ncbi:hypothetical protein FRB97_002493 [Tulasnella sp. 331]|nr:hypothetical protein FRB97_002493 [Tulasnella sp. 331]
MLFQLKNDWGGRYLITFANRDVADTWYRAVTDSVSQGYRRFAGVQRISLQWYTHDPENIWETVNDPKVAFNLRDKVFFTLLNDKNCRVLSTIPVLNYADHVNGARQMLLITVFYIRSVPQPDTYWSYDSSKGAVFASRSRRTMFTITIADHARAPGTIIVGSDDVYITTPSGIDVGIANTLNQLSRSVNPFPLRFSSFYGDFQIDHSLSESIDHVNDTVIVRNPGKGETWELV